MSKPTPLPPHTEELDLSGRRVADFQVLRKLGQGGMGQVYLAEQISLKRKVALKILRPELAASPQALARFRVEAEAVARITHANIVQVYAFDEKGDPPYMALEYVEGRNLREFVSKKGPPELLVALSIMRQVAAALQRASEAGIIHRDIKPENILLTRKGEVKVADFGLSRCLEAHSAQPALNLTQTGVTMGTPLYMSPEQVEGKPVDPRTDIYSFGVTCYHMLAGHPPFRGSTAFEVALQHVQKLPQPLGEVRPDLPEALCAIVHKMMAKSPDQRYQTGRELMRDISRLREALTGANPAVGLPTIQVEAVPASSLGVMADGAQTQATSIPSLPAPQSSGTFWASLVALSLLGAAGAGAAYAWHERSADKGTHPGEAAATDRVNRPSKREKELRESAERYLSGKARGDGGPALGMDLGLFYLEEGRPAEALEVFQRMERHKDQASYHLLGKFGKGIALALLNKAAEAKDVFQTLAPRKPKGAGGVGRPFLQKINILLETSQSAPRWRYFFGKALWAIRANGEGTPKLSLWLTQKAAPVHLFEKKN
jgi:serine/threonine-protein kinase